MAEGKEKSQSTPESSQDRDERLEEFKQKLKLVEMSLANATNKLEAGEALPASLIDDLIAKKTELKRQISRIEAGLDPVPYDHNQEKEREQEEDGEEKYGIPQRLKIRRRPYTMSEAALRQRREAAKSPKKREAMRGNKNAWKHGKYAQGFIDRFIRPCKSTCPNYPCSIIVEGGTKPGGICLDKASILTTFQAIQKAVKEKQYDDLNEIAALKVAGAMQVVDMLIEDIIRDNTIIKSEKYDKDGNVIGYEIKHHPSLNVLPKMLADLGLTLHDLYVTPKAVERGKTEEEGIKTIADLMSQVGQKIKKQQEDDDSDD